MFATTPNKSSHVLARVFGCMFCLRPETKCWCKERFELEFHEDYDGVCSLVVQNEKTATNRNPIRAEVTFKVINRAIARLGLVVYGPNSIEDRNFISKTPDLESFLERVIIPQRHKLVGKLYAYGTDGKNLGEYTSPSCIIRLRTESGREEDFDGSVVVDEDMTITVSEAGLPDFVLHVDSIAPHGLKGGDAGIVLYEKEKSATHKSVIGGSGNFTIGGDYAEIELSRSCHCLSSTLAQSL